MKRIVAIFLVAVIMIFGACGTVFAAEADPNITIVNPVADTPVNSTSLLISVKIMRPQTIKTTVLKETVTTQSTVAADGTVSETRTVTWNSVFESENFTTTTNLSFYTKKLENVAQGNYIVRVDTIGSDGKVLYQTSRSVTVAEKESEAEVFSSNSSGTVNNFLQSLLKSILMTIKSPEFYLKTVTYVIYIL